MASKAIIRKVKRDESGARHSGEAYFAVINGDSPKAKNGVQLSAAQAAKLEDLKAAIDLANEDYRSMLETYYNAGR